MELQGIIVDRLKFGNRYIVDCGECFPYYQAPERKTFWRVVAMDSEGIVFHVSMYESWAEAKHHLYNTFPFLRD